MSLHSCSLTILQPRLQFQLQLWRLNDTATNAKTRGSGEGVLLKMWEGRGATDRMSRL